MLGLEILDLWVRVVPIKLLEAAVEIVSTLDVLEYRILEAKIQIISSNLKRPN